MRSLNCSAVLSEWRILGRRNSYKVLVKMAIMKLSTAEKPIWFIPEVCVRNRFVVIGSYVVLSKIIVGERNRVAAEAVKIYLQMKGLKKSKLYFQKLLKSVRCNKEKILVNHLYHVIRT